MTARDYSVLIPNSSNRPSLARNSLERPSDYPSRTFAGRRMRLQIQTDLYVHLDCNPQHHLAPCSTVYELEDRTKPSISSF